MAPALFTALDDSRASPQPATSKIASMMSKRPGMRPTEVREHMDELPTFVERDDPEMNAEVPTKGVLNASKRCAQRRPGRTSLYSPIRIGGGRSLAGVGRRAEFRRNLSAQNLSRIWKKVAAIGSSAGSYKQKKKPPRS